MTPKRIAILGDGGWGTAIAVLLDGHGHDVVVWGHDPGYLRQVAERRENVTFLPGIPLPAGIGFEPDMGAAVGQADVVVSAIPTQYLRGALAPLAGRSGTVTADANGMRIPDPMNSMDETNGAAVRKNASTEVGIGGMRASGGAVGSADAPGASATAIPCPVLSLTKGIERETLARPSAILAEELGLAPDRIAVLSGPSHAEEVAKGLPASVTIAAADAALASTLQEVFMGPTFRVYTSTDLTGVELGGALKNVIAVAVGICEGLRLGDNARAALMTRGLAELTRLGVAAGGRPETFAGLSGMGDLITTCVSPHGRNRAVGLALAEGKAPDAIAAGTAQVAEGVHSCRSALALAKRYGVDLPIAETLGRVLHDGLDPRQAVHELMTRDGKAETVG
ncbi:MAG: NAD(P)H-dependent glycerol-3-phosphate dehydrogenase [Planctomycetota bacterium]